MERLEKIYLEITGRCNFDCRTCLRSAGAGREIEMSDETFSLFLNRLREIEPPEAIVFAGYGEPLMHPKLIAMISEIRKLGPELEILTNGYLLNESTSRALIAAGVRAISVSIDGLSAKVYESIRRGGDLKVLLDNLKQLKRVKAELGAERPQVNAEFVILKQNVDDIDRLIEMRAELGVENIIFSHLAPHTEEMIGESYYGKKFRPALARSITEKGFRLAETGKRRVGCDFLLNNRMVVASDGMIHPCLVLLRGYPCWVRDDFRKLPRVAYGSLKENSFDEIFDDLAYRRLREDARSDVDTLFPFCPGCYYNGACFDRANALHDCFGHPAPCSDCLWMRRVVLCP